MEAYINLIEKNIESHINSLDESNPSKEYLNYILFPGGKRLRPVLFLIFDEIYNGLEKENIDLASSIELIHNYSLIHDDLPAMDNDDYRRGKLTLHKKYSEDIAILTGDSLLNLSFELAINNLINSEEDKLVNKLKAVKFIFNSSGVNGMILGQVLDMRGNFTNSEEIEFMYSRKTVDLIRASIISPAIIYGASQEELNILDEFASNFGMFFQIRDDIEDYEEDRKIFKQTIISDISRENAIKLKEDKINKAYSSLTELKEKFKRDTTNAEMFLSEFLKREENG